MQIRRIRAKRIITKSKIGFYTLNHYVGCAHRCKYCYARIFGRKYYGIEDWGETIIIKENAAELARREAKPGMHVVLSTMSDPYQPIEAEERLTQRVVRALGEAGASIEILTKSPLVLRDLDLLKKYNVRVGFTIVSLGKLKVERDAPDPKARIEALKQLKGIGIRTYVFVAPILPETDVEAIVRATKDYADFYYFDSLKYADILGMDGFKPKRGDIQKIVEKYGVRGEILF
ncbi:MAG: radical SAM protein [Candidatus Diapherotrites archaeon]|nr:radical SAM protein [Candidatus Diapherotrites archaeon]